MERFCEKILPHLLTVAGIICLLCGGISLFYPEGSLIPGLGVIAMFVGTFFASTGYNLNIIFYENDEEE